MSISGFILVLGCAFAFSGLDLMRKMLAHRIRSTPLLFLTTAGAVPFFLVWFEVARASPAGSGYWIPGLASLILNIVANLAFLQAVRMSPLSRTIPLLALTPVFAAVLAIPLLGELPRARQWFGIILVVMGVFWLNLAATELRGWADSIRAVLSERGSQLMVVVALIWSVAMPLDKIAIQHSSVPFHGLALNVGVAMGALAILAARGRLKELGIVRQHWRMILLADLVSVLAIGLFLLALSKILIGVVETLRRGIGSILAVLSGHFFFSEKVGYQSFLAIALLGAGVALVTL